MNKNEYLPWFNFLRETRIDDLFKKMSLEDILNLPMKSDNEILYFKKSLMKYRGADYLLHGFKSLITFELVSIGYNAAVIRGGFISYNRKLIETSITKFLVKTPSGIIDYEDTNNLLATLNSIIAHSNDETDFSDETVFEEEDDVEDEQEQEQNQEQEEGNNKSKDSDYSEEESEEELLEDLLEFDKSFQAEKQDEIERIKQVKTEIKKKNEKNIKITGESIKKYMDERFEPVLDTLKNIVNKERYDIIIERRKILTQLFDLLNRRGVEDYFFTNEEIKLVYELVEKYILLHKDQIIHTQRAPYYLSVFRFLLPKELFLKRSVGGQNMQLQELLNKKLNFSWKRHSSSFGGKINEKVDEGIDGLKYKSSKKSENALSVIMNYHQKYESFENTN